MKRQTLLMVMVLATALTGCTGPSAHDSTRFSPATCPDDVASAVVGEVTCGYLSVPEDRADPRRTIRVFVTRITPPQRRHDDPMLVAGVDLAGLPNYGGVAPLAQRVGRDVIIVDSRGVGHSQPSLGCPEVDALRTDVLAAATDDPAVHQRFLTAVKACHDRLEGDGVDLSAYNVSAMAADAEDLRKALGVPSWNVVTYGTASRVALQMLRSAPDAMRSLLLDSPEVPGSDPRVVAATATIPQLEAVLAACSADQDCAAAFPDARASLARALKRLATAPVTLRLEDAASSGRVPVVFDDAMLLRTLRAMLSDGGSSGPLMTPQAVPAVLDRVNAGRLDTLASTLAPVVADTPTYCLGYLPKCLPQHRVSLGALYSAVCHDIAPLHTGQVPASPARVPGVTAAYEASPFVDVCTAWPVTGADPAVDDPVAGDVPTLVTIGQFAPYAPESVVRAGLHGLAAATYVVAPGVGHNVVASSDCLVDARKTWIDELSLAPPALGCLDEQTPPFVTDPSTVLDTSGSSSGDNTAAPTPSAPAPARVEGEWSVSLSRADMRAALAAGGFRDLSERFFRQQEIPEDGMRFLLRIERGHFSGVYNDGLDDSGAWYVGWSGAITIRGDEIELADPKAGTTDTLRFAVHGNRLTLTPLHSTPDTFEGLPTPVYARAYLAAQPFTRTDCAKVTPPCA